MAVSSALRVGRSLPAGKFLVLISVRGWVDPRAIVWLKGLRLYEIGFDTRREAELLRSYSVAVTVALRGGYMQETNAMRRLLTTKCMGGYVGLYGRSMLNELVGRWFRSFYNESNVVPRPKSHLTPYISVYWSPFQDIPALSEVQNDTLKRQMKYFVSHVFFTGELCLSYL
jgi:hypothetical protein